LGRSVQENVGGVVSSMSNRKNPDLHGNVPDTAEVALLLIDVINDLEFPGGESLLQHALPAAHNLASLKKRLKRQGVPIIYVNDNFGRWQSDFKKIVSHCSEDGVRGQPIAELLAPEEDDYFVLKPKHSGFFSTTLDLLLEYLGARTLILTGMAGNNCVLFTANDAYMRDFNLVVASDCVVSIRSEENDYALKQMQQVLKADIRPAAQIDLNSIRERADSLAGDSLAGKEESMATKSSSKKQQKVGIPANRRGQQMGSADQPAGNRERSPEKLAARGRLKKSNKMFADKSSQQIGSDPTISRTTSPSAAAMNSGGHVGETTGETVFKQRLSRKRASK
jgi:nicotinamidase-related amidase